MRILHVITPSRVSGAELMLLRIALEQQKRGDTVRVVSKPNPAFLERFRSEGIDTCSSNISGKLNLRATGEIRQVIRDFRPDVVHTHLSTATLWGARAARAEGTPCVAMMQAANSVFPYNRAPAVIAVAESVRQHLITSGVPANRTHTVHNSIDPAPFRGPIDTSSLRQELKLPNDAVCVGTLAHLTERKGHTDLLTALPAILAQAPNVYLLWGGEGPLREKLASQARQSQLEDRVLFLGYRKDTPCLHHLFDIFVLPSYLEGLPLALLEAMAAGKPCVATNVAGSPELVQDGMTGFIVEPGDVDALGDRVSRLALNKELRDTLGAAGSIRVEAEFTLAVAVSKLHEVYLKEMGRQKR